MYGRIKHASETVLSILGLTLSCVVAVLFAVAPPRAVLEKQVELEVPTQGLQQRGGPIVTPLMGAVSQLFKTHPLKPN